MSQGLLPYTVEAVPASDALTARAGLPLVVEMLRALGLDRVIAEAVRVRERASGYTETEKVEALVLLLAAGGTCLDDITLLRADAGLMRLLGRRLPAADTLRHFLYACHDDQLLAQAQAARPQACRGAFPTGGVAVGDHHLGPRLRQAATDGQPDPLAAAGDDGNLPLEQSLRRAAPRHDPSLTTVLRTEARGLRTE